MKAVVMTGCVLLSLGLKTHAQNDEDSLDEAFLTFLSEWAEAEEALDNMIVLDTLIDRANPEQTNKQSSETSNSENKKANSTRKEASHDH